MRAYTGYMPMSKVHQNALFLYKKSKFLWGGAWKDAPPRRHSPLSRPNVTYGLSIDNKIDDLG